jgi:hypothetical protein
MSAAKRGSGSGSGTTTACSGTIEYIAVCSGRPLKYHPIKRDSDPIDKHLGPGNPMAFMSISV